MKNPYTKAPSLLFNFALHLQNQKGILLFGIEYVSIVYRDYIVHISSTSNIRNDKKDYIQLELIISLTKNLYNLTLFK